MENNKYYTCKYCCNEFEPKRRRVQKFCSNTCRSKAHHEKKTSNKKISKTIELKNSVNAVDLPSTPNTTKIETMSFAGVGNAALGTLAADSLRHLATKEENRPATKADIKNLTDKLVNRYYQVINLPNRNDGAKPYFDIETKELLYSLCSL